MHKSDNNAVPQQCEPGISEAQPVVRCRNLMSGTQILSARAFRDLYPQTVSPAGYGTRPAHSAYVYGIRFIKCARTALTAADPGVGRHRAMRMCAHGSPGFGMTGGAVAAVLPGHRIAMT